VDDKGALWYKNRICVPKEGKFQELILDEAHNSAYSIHPSATKMYMDLKERYWWNGIKADVAQFIAQYDVCQRVKAEHQKPAGLLQPLPIPIWKWNEIGMDFVSKLRKGNSGPRLTKVAHFIPMHTKYSGDKLAQLYVDNIVKVHGVPSRIVFDRGT